MKCHVSTLRSIPALHHTPLRVHVVYPGKSTVRCISRSVTASHKL